MGTLFDQLAAKAEKGDGNLSETDFRYLTGAVCVPLMLGSSSRPGAISCVTQTEFEQGRQIGDTYVVSVMEHKTNMKGCAHLEFGPDLLARARKYKEVIRPLITAEKGTSLYFLALGRLTRCPMSHVC